MRKKLLFTLLLMSASANANDLSLIDVVRTTIEQSPNIHLKKYTANSTKAKAKIAAGAFDFNTRMSVSYQNKRGVNRVLSELNEEDRKRFPIKKLPNIRAIDNDRQSFSAGVSKKFRFGAKADLSLKMNRVDPRLDAKTSSSPVGITNNTTAVQFSLTVPLLKGAGYISAAANENAAKVNHSAQVADVQHFISSETLKSVKAYWDYKRAAVFLEKIIESEQRVNNWVQRLKRPSPSLTAFLEEKKGNVIDARQTLEEAQVNLAVSMGLPASESPNIGQPVTNFTLEWDGILANFNKAQVIQKWTASSLENRLDLKATQLRLESSHILLAKAKHDTLPRVDVKVGVGYNGYRSNNGFGNYLDSFHSNMRGLDSSASLNFSYPIGNHAAEGQEDLKQAGYQQSLIKNNEKQRLINLAINKEAINVQGRLQKVVQIRKTTQLYKRSVLDLQQNSSYFNDTVKLLSLMELENKFIDSLLESSIAFADLFKAIAQARFQTGSLLVVNADSNSVALNDIITLP
ncbi:MAG: TolC family protein [Methylococcales bacterium]|nr:TolC family protein [Methylococcales bacterium]